MTGTSCCQPLCSHQPSYAFLTTAKTLRSQFRMNARTAIYPSIGMESCFHLFSDLYVFPVMLTHGTFSPGVVPTDRHLQDLAERAHGIFPPILFNNLVLHRWSCAKRPTVFLRDRVLASHAPIRA